MSHTLFALMALLIGIRQLINQKGDNYHKKWGWWFVGLMIFVCVSSFSIQEIKPHQLSWIHALSILSLFFLAVAIFAIRKKNIYVHKLSMIGVFLSLSVAGFLALFSPGRLLSIL